MAYRSVNPKPSVLDGIIFLLTGKQVFKEAHIDVLTMPLVHCDNVEISNEQILTSESPMPLRFNLTFNCCHNDHIIWVLIEIGVIIYVLFGFELKFE